MATDDEIELFNERVAIMVHDGKIDEITAKAEAKLQILKMRNYEILKQKWLAENPQATSQEYENFIKELADRLKI